MKKITPIFLVSLLLILSCKKTSDKVVYEPPVFRQVIPKTVTVFGDTIDDIGGSLLLLDSFLIMEHPSTRNEQMFQVYNRNTGKHVQSFGNKGKGYGELIYTSGVSIDNKTKNMYVGATNHKKIAVFTLDSLGFGKVGVSEIKLEQPMSGLGFFSLEPNHFLTSYNPHIRFALYDSNLRVIDTCNYYSPTRTGNSAEPALPFYYLYCSNIIIKPDGTKFANSTFCGGIFEIFDIKQDRITHLTTNYFYKPAYNDKNGMPLWNECLYGARAPIGTDKYIYIPLNGTREDFAQIEKVSVFDWAGNPIKQYDLGVNILRMVVDEEAGKAYVIFRDKSLEYRLGYFEL